jgi:PAP2 superfamily
MLQWLPWQDAAWGAGGCAVLAIATRRARAPVMKGVRTWTRELALMFALYGLWQYAGDLSVDGVSGAVGRGRRLWDLERSMGLPSEVNLQRMVLGHRELMHLLNIYYADVHVPVLGLCLIWLFVRHRAHYPAVRNVLVLVTGACLLIQLIPVAPPRLVPGLGIVDTGRLIGPSTYPTTVAPGLDQLSSMPSLHVGWALIVAGSMVWALRSRWRWLACVYPALTWWVVIVTGNHYWLDGFVALFLAALATGAVAVVRRVGRTRSDQAADEQRTPEGGPGQSGEVDRPLVDKVPWERQLGRT